MSWERQPSRWGAGLPPAGIRVGHPIPLGKSGAEPQAGLSAGAVAGLGICPSVHLSIHLSISPVSLCLGTQGQELCSPLLPFVRVSGSPSRAGLVLILTSRTPAWQI